MTTLLGHAFGGFSYTAATATYRENANLGKVRWQGKNFLDFTLPPYVQENLASLATKVYAAFAGYLDSCRHLSPLVSGKTEMLKKLWLDEGGAVLSVELILLLVIVVIGIVVGMTALRDSIDFKFVELAEAVNRINPSYAVGGITYAGISGSAGSIAPNGAVVPSFGLSDTALSGIGSWSSPTSFASVLTGGSVLPP
jgi:Flp pilus assembly pilin Flp